MKVKKFFETLIKLDKLNQQFNQVINEEMKAAKKKLKEQEEDYKKYGSKVYNIK